MALPKTAPMPEDLIVGDGYTLKWSAVSPTDGSAITGVVVSSVNVAGDILAGVLDEAQFGPFALVPGPEA